MKLEVVGCVEEIFPCEELVEEATGAPDVGEAVRADLLSAVVLLCVLPGVDGQLKHLG